MALTKVTYSMIEGNVINAVDFGAVGDGTADDTAAIQAALDSLGSYTNNSDTTTSPVGLSLYVPAGIYKITDTLYVPENIKLYGDGSGTQFKFDPSTPFTDFIKPKLNSTGGVANESNFTTRYQDFVVYAALTGGTIPGYGGVGTYPARNTNAQHCFNIYSCARTAFERVGVIGFLYGVAFYIYDATTKYSYYNYLLGCYTRDCDCDARIYSATDLTNCFFSESVNFPTDALLKVYMVELDGAGISMSGGSVEGNPTYALIQDSANGTSITGVYTEHFSGLPNIDSSGKVNNAGGSLYAGNHYGFGPNNIIKENVVRTGTDVFTQGGIYGAGECDELLIQSSTNKQSASFRSGLPDSSHFPAGGSTGEDTTTSFIGKTSVILYRGAGTATTDNQLSYAFEIPDSNFLTANIWITVLVKLTNETNYSIKVYDTTNGNVNLQPIITYTNGWQLFGNYLQGSANSSYTLYLTQLAGSTDPTHSIRLSAIRAYTNGYKPIPAVYSDVEKRNAVPSGGTWNTGDMVLNSVPVSGQPFGWMCTAGGTPGTWKSMGNLA